MRYAHFGEGDYDKTESAIRALLAEARRVQARGDRAARDVEVASRELATPETYLNYERAQNFDPPLRPGTGSYEGTDDLPPVHFSLSGTWKITEGVGDGGARRVDQRARDRAQGFPGAGHERRTAARRAGAAGRAPAAGRRGGAGRQRGRATVSAQRLYRLVSLPRVEDRRLTLKLPPGVSGYAFTFG